MLPSIATPFGYKTVYMYMYMYSTACMHALVFGFLLSGAAIWFLALAREYFKNDMQGSP